MKNINLNLKKNQVIIFFIAIMLVVVGYLNYTGVNIENFGEEPLKLDDVAGIGDAKLVSSNSVVEEKKDEIGALVDNEKDDFDEEKKEIVSTKADVIEEIEDEYYVGSKLERDKMFSQMIESYQKILENNQISEDQKAIAQTEIKRINDLKNAIMISENLLKNKDFEDVIIFVNDKSINVIVKKKELLPQEIAKIQNIVARELQAKIEDIHVSTKID